MSKRKHSPLGYGFIVTTLLKIGYGAVLICATIVLTWAFSYARGGSFYTFVGFGYMLFYLLFVPALVMLILGKTVSATLRVVGLAWVPVVIFAILVLGYGFLKDAQGTHCTGFFDAPTSCASNQYLLVLILLFNPYTVLAWMSLSILGLMKGWYDYFKDPTIAHSRR